MSHRKHPLSMNLALPTARLRSSLTTRRRPVGSPRYSVMGPFSTQPLYELPRYYHRQDLSFGPHVAVFVSQILQQMSSSRLTSLQKVGLSEGSTPQGPSGPSPQCCPLRLSINEHPNPCVQDIFYVYNTNKSMIPKSRNEKKLYFPTLQLIFVGSPLILNAFIVFIGFELVLV